jgi:hypothetical protein
MEAQPQLESYTELAEHCLWEADRTLDRDQPTPRVRTPIRSHSLSLPVSSVRRQARCLLIRMT